MPSLSYITKKGSEIHELLHELAALRIAVFRDFPYLYEGSIAYELEYLKPYLQSPRSLLFGVYHEQQLVGATTCLPLQDETTEIQQPFLQAGYELELLFYFGESILLREFRGQGLGNRFFDEREAHARSFGTYTKACFLAVERELNHPAKPVNYRSNDAFWEKRGYKKHPALRTSLSWPDIGETASTPKPLVGWMHDL